MAANFNLRTWWRRVLYCSFLAWLITTGASNSSAAIQFDVFLGYDSVVPEASWFPIVCEIKNDGPSFKASVEVSGGAYNQGQTLRAPVELPTGTLKRIVLPFFSNTRSFTSWEVKLLDERGRVRAEQPSVRPRKLVARGTPILGALSRTAGGVPAIRPVLPQAPELQPAAARLMPAIFPDNPIVLEGLTCLYLNSERAADLSVSQVNAILAWLHLGGHLIVAVEQPSEVSSSPWLKALVPMEVSDLRTLDRHAELQEWLRDSAWSAKSPLAQSMRRTGPRYAGQPAGTMPTQTEISEYVAQLPSDSTFETAPMQVAVGRLKDATVEIAGADTQLMISARRGRGKVTTLLFSPEREPLRSWKNLDLFWAKLIEVPPALYLSKDFNLQGGYSSDGIFGGMIDSRQVHKLPIGWLLLLLIVYLVVIGPFDQYWLKRIGKPMLTWITFPCYVVIFSLVIYFIGYKLRAGESEWNDLHVVDVLPKGESAELRGRTYSSVYSPSNQRYTLLSPHRYGALRGEFSGFWGGGQSNDKATVLQSGDTFKAEIFVPVWTSELYVSDWWQPAPVPLAASVRRAGEGWEVQVNNHLNRNVSNLQIVIGDRIANLGEVPAQGSKTFSVAEGKATSLSTFVASHGGEFQTVVTSRQRALGSSERGQISDLPNTAAAVSFLSHLNQSHVSFIAPPGLDLTPLTESGDAILLAWMNDHSPTQQLYQFTPRRSQKHTLWRLTCPVQ